MLRSYRQVPRYKRCLSSFLNAKDLMLDASSTIPATSSTTKVGAPSSDSIEKAFRSGTNLAKYATNLSKLAESGKLEEVIGREKEIQQAIQVLSRRRKNNPCLIGEPGVGKTCIAEGLATLIHQGRVPQSMRNKVIVSLDLPSMLAGTKFRGEFEERLKGVIKEIEQCDERIVLFIDEVHILVGAGGSEGSIDAANILKPSLARGTLRCIGTTTTEEYRKHIEKDPALARRFQSVFVCEPSEKDTIEILKGLRPRYEEHHRIRLPDAVLTAIVSLAARYLPMKRFPDKAIDLMDEAAARLRLSLESPPAKLVQIDEEIRQLHATAAATHSGEMTVKEELLLHKLEEDRKPLQDIWRERNRVWDEIAALQTELQTKQRDSANRAARHLQQLTLNSFQDSSASTVASSSAIVSHSSSKLLEKSPEDTRLLQQKHARLHDLYHQLHRHQQALKQLTHISTDASVSSDNCDVSQEDIVGDAIDVLRVQDIASIISEALDVPIHSVTGPDETMRQRLLQLEDTLNAHVIGQQTAIHKISRAIKVSRAGLRGGDRPIGVFMLLGPTGVGKTELAKALAAELFPDRPASDRFLRLDMSEFMEKFNVSRLTGAPPGYVGHEDGGRLTEAVKQRPYQLILLDEFEKAHRDVSQLLLQVFDAGRLTDAAGTTVDFTNTVLIMTSNLGANVLYPNQTTREKDENEDGEQKKAEKEAEEEENESSKTEKTQALALQLVQQHFSPEFVNRLDDILVFQPLNDAAMEKICGLQIKNLQNLLLKERKLNLTVTPAAQKIIAKRGGDTRFGARPLKRYLQTEVMAPLADILLEGDIQPGDSIYVHHVNDATDMANLMLTPLNITNSDLSKPDAAVTSSAFLSKSSRAIRSNGLFRQSFNFFASSTSGGAFPTVNFRVNPVRKIEFDASTDVSSFAGDVLIVPYYQSKTKESKLPYLQLSDGNAFSHPIVNDLLNDNTFNGEANTEFVVRIYNSPQNSLKYVALVGLGTEETSPSAQKQQELSKRLANILTNIAEKTNAKNVGLVLPGSVSSSQQVSHFMLRLHDILYQDNRFRMVKSGSKEEGQAAGKEEATNTEPKKGKQPGGPLKHITLLATTPAVISELSTIQQTTEKIVSGVNFAKDLVGAPPNSKTPVAIAEAAKEMAQSLGLEAKVLGLEECQQLNMGGYLGVQQGSKFPPQFLHLTYRPPSSETNKQQPVKKIALIGKGLTFDSGGYNLKSGAGSMIELMKFDMGGCGAILGAAKAIAQLKPENVEVHFISAVCENMVSSQAMRPGDILFASNGRSIEVLNTDAEGRLTLADAIVYAERLHCDAIVDLATLTGACIMGLGDKVAAVYANDVRLLQSLQRASETTGEKLWHLPLEESYRESIKSTLADLKNISGGKGGGSITAALFLQEFLDKAPATGTATAASSTGVKEKKTQTPWAHIDMAGPVWEYTNNKPTGFGVQLLVDYIQQVNNNSQQ